MPPDRNAPSGTSAISRSRTDSSSSERNCSIRSASRRRCGHRIRRPAEHPSTADLHASLLVDEPMAGQQLVDAFEQRLGCRRCSAWRAASDSTERFSRASIRPLFEHRLDLGCEEQASATCRGGRPTAQYSGLTPSRSRTSSSRCRRSSQMAKANMPRNRSTQSSPHSS